MLQGDRVSVCAVRGMGGVGKTEFALQYAFQYIESDYQGGVCWVLARDLDIGSQIIEFARTKLDIQPPDDLDLRGRVTYCWERWSDMFTHSEKALVVFDDVTEYKLVKPFLPPLLCQFRVLITTRSLLGKSVRQRELNVLSSDATLELLQSLVDDDRIVRERDAAIALCEWLGFLPLGVELVGRYLARKSEISLTEMQQRLRSKRLAQPALKKSKQDDDMTAQLGVAAAFELSWQELNENARELGCLLSLFALAPLSWEWVKRCCPDLDDEELEESRDDALIALHLLQVSERNTEHCNFKLHQLVREFFQAKLAEDKSLEQKLKSAFVQSMLSISKPVPQEITLDIVRDLAPAIPHLKEVTGNLINYITDDDLVWSFLGIVRFYGGQGFYAQAETYLEKCLDITKKRLGNHHLHITTILGKLARIYELQGKYQEAETCHLQAKKLKEEILGVSHSDIAVNLNNLAEFYRLQGKHEEVKYFCQQAQELSQKSLDADPTDIAAILNTLALTYTAERKYKEAEPIYKQALQLYRNYLGDRNSKIATIQNNLAALYRLQRRYSESEDLYQQSLQLNLELFGTEHPDVAQCLHNFAYLRYNQNRYNDSESLFLQALKIREALLPSNHPDTISTKESLAYLRAKRSK